MGVSGRSGYRWKDLSELSEASPCPTEASQTANFENARQLWAAAQAVVGSARAKRCLHASSRGSGSDCTHSRALVTAQPRLHHTRLAAQYLAALQHGAVLHGTCGACVALCTMLLVEHACYVLELGPRLTRSNLACVILLVRSFAAASSFWRRALQRLQPQAGPRAAVAWFAAVLCVTTTSCSSCSTRLEVWSAGSNAARGECVAVYSLTDVFLCGGTRARQTQRERGRRWHAAMAASGLCPTWRPSGVAGVERGRRLPAVV